jgi:hypothetical protein
MKKIDKICAFIGKFKYLCVVSFLLKAPNGAKGRETYITVKAFLCALVLTV